MMKVWTLLLVLALPWRLCASEDPYLAETRAQGAIESGLSHLIPNDQYLVLVNAELVVRTERKVVESESMQLNEEPSRIVVPQMPGFYPDPQIDEEKQNPKQMRQMYRTVERPELSKIRVHVNLDDTLTADQVARARQFTESYLRMASPNKSLLSFGRISMLKKAKETPTPTPDPKDMKKEEEATWTKYLPWAILAFFSILAVAILGRRPQPPALPAGRDAGGPPMNPWANWLPGLSAPGGQAAPPSKGEESEFSAKDRRKQLLRRFLSASKFFTQYYLRLTAEEKNDLFASMRGVAFESFLDGLGIRKPDAVTDPPSVEECLERHAREFEEFSQAKNWQRQQFFGFLHELSHEQLNTLVSHQAEQVVCIMLRFMRADQSAFILDTLAPDRRVEILAQVPFVQQVSFSEIQRIENEVRAEVERMPTHLYGSRKEDVEFWGSVVSESENQSAILDALERTQPEIYPLLSKYRFTLNDAASLPDDVLAKVLGNTDNGELCLALTGCNHEVVSVLLDAVSPKRRELLESQLASSRGADKEATRTARLQLTRKFREAMA